MKTLHQIGTQFLFGCLLFLVGAETSVAAGLLTPTNGSAPPLEIKAHKVNVVIEDGYAITSVEQLFHNPHSSDLEAIYSFPVPEKAAVSEFTMWIDGKPVHGEVLEKKKAREVYETQKAAGNDAGITEKDSYKTFDITVFPVRAGQDTRIRLSYIQPTKVDSSIGHYVYPLEEGGVDEAKLSFWTASTKVTSDFSFDVSLRSGYPIDGIRLPNHPAAVFSQQGDTYHIHLGNTQTVTQESPQKQSNPTNVENTETQSITYQSGGTVFSLDKDIVLYYRHATNLPGAVDLVTHKPDAAGRGTFMLTVTPAMDLQPITNGQDWTFVLDISGSMQGKFNTLAEGVRQALGKMRPEDRFRIILFNNGARELTNGYTLATTQNITEYTTKVETIQVGGGTNVYDGLQMGLRKLDSDRTSAILLVTDGVANVGVTKQKKFLELIRKYDVRLFTFIMGNSANLPLLNAITEASGGFSMSISNSDDIVGAILQAKSKVTHQALHGASLSIKGIKTLDLTPEKIGSLYRGEQLILFGHYFGDGEAEVTLKGKISGTEKRYQTRFPFPKQTDSHPELERLWAYATIEELSQKMEDFGEDADMKNGITDLGIEYGLVTDYTSMVVVKDEIFQQLGIERRNNARLHREYGAQEQRAKQNVTSNRVDSKQPMFSANRPTTKSSGGGAGAFDAFGLLLLLPLLVVWRISKPKSGKK